MVAVRVVSHLPWCGTAGCPALFFSPILNLVHKLARAPTVFRHRVSALALGLTVANCGADGCPYTAEQARYQSGIPKGENAS